METILTIAGIIITILGILAIAIVSGVYIAVKYLGANITFGTYKDGEEE